MADYPQDNIQGQILLVDVSGQGIFDYEFSLSAYDRTTSITLNIWN